MKSVPAGYELDFMVFQMCKSSGQSKVHIEENFTAEEIVEWFQFEMYQGYVERKQREK